MLKSSAELLCSYCRLTADMTFEIESKVKIKNACKTCKICLYLFVTSTF